MAKFCNRCGKPIVEGNLFCTNCGARVADPIPEQNAYTAPQMQPQADQQPQQQMPYQAPYGQQSYYQQPAYIPPQPPKKKKTGLIAGIILVVFLVAVFLVTAFAWPGFLKPTNEIDESSNYHESRRQDDEEVEEHNSKTAEESSKETITEVEESSHEPIETIPSDFPAPVVDPALVGTWGLHDKTTDVDIVWTFNADGTGSYYANGYEMPIASYIATNEPYTQYEEDGFLITVYYGEMTTTMGNETVSVTLDPMEYGYLINGNTLRIVFSRDIANHFTDFTRE
ncbi:MAG: zinc-ribbon domain-containing protein [Firmicutes bacterium]|nr:zinc-ribbon domain-containing protein [Bacillota bacterium]